MKIPRRAASPKPSKKKPGRFSGNHQRGWLWGHHAVVETLTTGTWPVTEMYANSQALEQFSDLLLAKQNAGIPLHVVDNARLEQLSRSSEHQGLVIRLGAFPYQSIQDWMPKLMAARSATRPVVPLVVICDRIQDAFNFGAILRCCDGVNVIGVIVGEHGQADVTPHVVRSSSGAVNHLAVVRVADTIATARMLQNQGVSLVAADSNTVTSVWGCDLTGPMALVIGSEATGIAPDLLAICDHRVSIPMRGRVSSLNAAVAAGILLYEIRRQQELKTN